MITPFRRVRSQDQDLTKVQDAIENTLKNILSNPLLDGRLIEDVEIISPDLSISIDHKLGRALKGWFITRKNAAVHIHDTQDTNDFPTKTLNLTAGNTVTIDLWVF